MTQELVSLTIIMAVAALSPIVVQLVPGKFIPQTVLLLAAGAALGPYGFGVITVNDAVKLLSELGLAFLFLLAGYEINPKRLAGHQGKMGLVTWLVTLAIAWAVITLVPFFSKQGMNGFAAVITLTTTALGTLMPILKERNLEGTPVGDAIISYGTWGELGPVLAMAVLLSTRTGWQTLLILGAFLAICIICAAVPAKARKTGHIAYRFLTENANTSSQTMMRMTVFLLIFLVTISALFDLDAVLGAFAAGFILRYIIPDGMQSLETKLEGIGYGFLIPVFFVVSGAAINVQAVVGQPALLITFIAMLMLIRAVPVYLAMSLDKKENPMSTHHRVTVALYCTTALPVIVAVTSLAVKVGTMQQTTASTLVAAGAVTVFLMPLLGSLTYHIADSHPVTALREIARTPADWHRIMHDHAQVRALLRHQDMLDSMTTDLKASGHRDDHRFILAKRARREISRRLEELGLDPNKTDRLPRNYRYPKN
ncbi:cation:proton antiporter [Bifidobacterium moukalabense]|uniref:cation:proton antiporter n=1 Tax=Bifidobacterium moukalabense TaxID=1333651 RepID=UPI0010F5A181|nr:cation:proton antiporter [Bifidobacterium moukalabense]